MHIFVLLLSLMSFGGGICTATSKVQVIGFAEEKKKLLVGIFSEAEVGQDPAASEKTENWVDLIEVNLSEVSASKVLWHKKVATRTLTKSLERDLSKQIKKNHTLNTVNLKLKSIDGIQTTNNQSESPNKKTTDFKFKDPNGKGHFVVRLIIHEIDMGHGQSKFKSHFELLHYENDKKTPSVLSADLFKGTKLNQAGISMKHLIFTGDHILGIGFYCNSPQFWSYKL